MKKVDYGGLVTKLVEESHRNDNPKQFCFSGYYPIDGQSREATKNELTTYFEDELKNRFKGKEEWYLPMLKVADEKLEEVDNWQEGVGLFGWIFPPEKQEAMTNSLTVIPLNRKPRPEVIIDKTFSLDQLVWMGATQITALIVEVNHKEVRVFDLVDDELNILWEKENPFVSDRNKENKKSVKYGEETAKLQREESSENQLFLNHISEMLPKISRVFEYKYMSVIYSESMGEEVIGFKKKLERNFPNLRQVQLIKSVPQSEEETKDLTIEKIREGQGENKINVLKMARENFNLFVSGWNQVCRAARNRRINKLFILSNVKKNGYIIDNEFVYSYKMPRSKKVESIGPWIVADVINTGGDVFVFSPEEKPDINEVAALLRY